MPTIRRGAGKVTTAVHASCALGGSEPLLDRRPNDLTVPADQLQAGSPLTAEPQASEHAAGLGPHGHMWRAYDPAASPRRSTARQISARIGVSATTRAAQSSGNSISTLREISLVGQPNLRASARVMRLPLDTQHFTIFADLRSVTPRLRGLGTPTVYAGMSCLPRAKVESSALANLGPYRISPQRAPLLLPVLSTNSSVPQSALKAVSRALDTHKMP